MIGSVFVGIDIGTTNLKAAAFDGRNGQLLAHSARRLPTQVETDGTREQQVDDLMDATAQVLGDLRCELSGQWAEVAGLGLAAQGGSGAIVDRDTGKALTSLMLWNDSRAYSHIPIVAAMRSAAYWQELSQRQGPGSGLARMHWLKKCRPDLPVANTLYAGAGELAFFDLTGKWRQDACNALQMGCYRVLENRLDEEPLQLVGNSLSSIAPLRNGHETLPLLESSALRLGLSPGIPVAGPYMDHEAGYLSATQVSRRPLQCSLGTAWVGNFLVSSPTAGYSPIQLVISSPVDTTASLVIQPLLTGNVSWDWGLTQFLNSDLSSALGSTESLFEESLLPPDGMLCLPWLTQANPLTKSATGAGAFFGVGIRTNRGDFVRALAAGMCFEFYRVFEQLKQVAGIDALVLGGGASEAFFFQRLFSALFDPIAVYALEDVNTAGARGSLFALSKPAASAPSHRIPLPEDEEAHRRILSQYESYKTLFQELLGHVPAGTPYRLLLVP